VASASPISRVTFVRSGSVTHSFNTDQRFLELGFTQDGQTLTITLPTTDPNIVLPGYYMLFVFDQAGVPSAAWIVQVIT
jgi:large repetitive protein